MEKTVIEDEAIKVKEKEVLARLEELAAEKGIDRETVDAMYKAFKGGATISDVLNISREAMESAYAYAYRTYTAGDYNNAETLFRGLCLYDNRDYRYWMGLAACLQARQAWDNAIEIYGMAAFMNAFKYPAPTFYAGIC